MKHSLLLASAALALASASASNAAIISETFDLTGTDFTVYFGDGSVPPAVDPVYLNFSATFDNSASFDAQVAGFTVNSFNLPYALTMSYNVFFDILTIATVGSASSCSHPAFSFCAFISNVSTAPNLIFLEQSPSAGGWIAQTRVLTVGAPAVPEPASWAMMIGGMAVVGAAMRRRQTQVSFA
jgi:hypothetical protein